MISKPARLLLLSFAIYILAGPRPALAQTPAPEVAVTGSISSRSIDKDELLPFTLTIKNKTDAKANHAGAVYALKLLRLPDSYVLDETQQICVLPLVSPRKASCQTSQEFRAVENVLIDSLAPGESISAQGYLKPSQPHRASQLIAVVSWTVAGPRQGPAEVSSAQAANLGENQVRDWYQVEWVTDVVKALGLPAALALITTGIATYIGYLSKKKEERAAKRQQEQALRAETWKQMLLVSHKYAAKCYLPLSLAAERLALNLENVFQPTGNPKITFYYVLQCGKRMAKTRRDTGGFYFKDLRGEALAAICWKTFRETLLGNDEDAAFHLAATLSIERISSVETYAAFKQTFESGAPSGQTYNDAVIEQAWGLFQSTIQGQRQQIPQVVTALQGFVAALDYESNRPYKYWYDLRDKLSLDQKPEVKKLFEKILTEDGRFTREQVESYIAGREDPEGRDAGSN